MSTPVDAAETGPEGIAEQRVLPRPVWRGDKVLKFVDWVLETLALTALMALMVLTVANAVMRYVFNDSIPGSVNMTLLYVMPTLVFLALPRVQAVHAHIAAAIVVDRLGAAGRRICAVIVRLVVVLIMLIMFSGAVQELVNAWGSALNGYLALPLGPSWLFVPIGLAGAVVRGIWQLLTVRFDRSRDGDLVDESGSVDVA